MFNFEYIDINCDFEQAYNKELEARKNSGKYRRLILIVPKQSSHTVEAQVAKYFGGVGFNNIEVMTFRQIIRTFVQRDEDAYIDDVGQTLLTSRALIDACGEDSVFGTSINRTGFVTDTYKLLCEMLNYDVSPETLLEVGEAEGSLLGVKLKAFADIYSSYNRIFASRGYKTAEDDTINAAVSIEEGNYFDSAYVFVSLFTELVPQQLKILNAIFRKAKDVTVHLFRAPSKDGDNAPFKTISKMEEALISLCEKNNLAFEYGEYVGEMLANSNDLQFLSANYFNYKTTELLDAESIQLVSAKNIFDEVIYTANIIENLVRTEDELRYGEIGIVTTDFENYAPIINTVFDKFEIPIFSDYKDPIINHPISVLLEAVFSIIENNYQSSDVIRLLRTGLVIPMRYWVDRIENFLLARGIRGGMWEDESFWQLKRVTEDDETTDSTYTADEWDMTRSLYDALVRLDDATSKKAKPSVHIKALFEFFDAIGLYENLNKKIDELKDKDNDSAVRYSKIWNNLIKLTEQINVVLSDIECTFCDFVGYINMGIASTGIALIPQGVDRVSVAPFGKTSGEPVKILFVLGATHTGLEGSSKTGSIFTEAERRNVADAGIKLALYGSDRVNAEKLKLYRTLLRAKERLIITYPAVGVDGTTNTPASIFDELMHKFSGLVKKTSDIGEGIYSSPHAMEFSLMHNLVRGGYSDKKWRHVAKWFDNNIPEVTGHIANIRRQYEGIGFKNLEPGVVGGLYPDSSIYSASRIQTYFDCPYEYFLQYGLHLKEQEVYEVKPTDIGTILHAAIQGYCKAVDGEIDNAADKKSRWDELPMDESISIAEKSLDEATSELRDTEYNKKLKGKVHDILLRSVDLINKEYKLGKFTSGGYEWKFEDLKFGDSTHTVTLRGAVDRFDIYTNPDIGKTYIRIFDYKTGKKEYKALNVERKLDVQLIIYALAIAEARRNEQGAETETAGVFYEHVINNFQTCDVNNVDTVNNDMTEMRSGTIYYDFIEGDRSNQDLFMAYDKDIYNESKLFKTRFTTKGEPNKHSKNLHSPMDKVQELCAFVKKSILYADSEIMQGRIEAEPYNFSENSACTKYGECKFKDICDLYDRGNRNYRTE